MSWDSTWAGNRTVHERAEALWAQHEAEMARAAERRASQMAKQKSPMGVTRADLDTERARDAVNRVNQALDSALDEVRAAFQREAQMREGDKARRAEDAQRAPVLGGRS